MYLQHVPAFDIDADADPMDTTDLSVDTVDLYSAEIDHILDSSYSMVDASLRLHAWVQDYRLGIAEAAILSAANVSASELWSAIQASTEADL